MHDIVSPLEKKRIKQAVLLFSVTFFIFACIFKDVVEYTARQAERREAEKRERMEMEAERKALTRLKNSVAMAHRLERVHNPTEPDRTMNVKKGGSGSQIFLLIHGALSRSMRYQLTQNWQPYLPFFAHLGTFYAIDLTVSVDTIAADADDEKALDAIKFDDKLDDPKAKTKENNKNNNKNNQNNKDRKKPNPIIKKPPSLVQSPSPSSSASPSPSTSPSPSLVVTINNSTLNSNTTNNNNSHSGVGGDRTTSEQVELLKSLMKEEKVTTPVVLVGHYYGARVALELAKEMPNAVKDIILIAPNLNKNFVAGLPSYVLNMRTLFFWAKTDPLSSFKRFTGYKDSFTRHTLIAFDPPDSTLHHTLEFLLQEEYQEALADWVDE